MYYIRSRKIPWHKVSENKAKSYAKVLLKVLGVRIAKDYQKSYLEKFIKTPDINKFMAQTGGEYFEQ